MSNALIESPATASQLYFAWSEPDSSPHALPATREETPTYEPLAKISQPAKRDEPLALTPEGRIAKPVRMGAIMIKLLKRYGITDAEIEEGVANYARQHQPATAAAYVAAAS